MRGAGHSPLPDVLWTTISAAYALSGLFFFLAAQHLPTEPPVAAAVGGGGSGGGGDRLQASDP